VYFEKYSLWFRKRWFDVKILKIISCFLFRIYYTAPMVNFLSPVTNCLMSYSLYGR